MRNLDYMQKILKKFPTFIWLSDLELSKEELADTYRVGIEFFHGSSMGTVRKFIESECWEDIVVVIDFYFFKEIQEEIERMKEDRKIRNYFVYVRNGYEKEIVGEENYQIVINELVYVLFQENEYYVEKNLRKENPKIIFFNQ